MPRLRYSPETNLNLSDVELPMKIVMESEGGALA
jgi:hypothetical protein